MWELVYVCFAIFNAAALVIPKKLSNIEIYATTFFAFTYGVTIDMILDLHYGLYGYFEEGFQWLGLLGIVLYFPSISILFLNLYPLENKTSKKIIYIIAWTLFSITFEWFCLHTHFFYYNGWKIWYSALAYPVIFSILLLNLKLVRKLVHLNV
ncbi:CBO0543 family protein [Mesobacillus foraminis]|uniref:Uncharacterized protein n=1 Tax=Mesobacillus foraminis TaxID=279826 RepID=A0A4R2B4B5_9BACI|nr:CBO0543 family protein [Mesobacillus foraminis]TCN20532.1 hypothetical protein EV146_114152 [Mesobacillus foraminis]